MTTRPYILLINGKLYNYYATREDAERASMTKKGYLKIVYEPENGQLQTVEERHVS